MSTPIFHRFPAPAKLNLLLHVVGKRPDGYHLLETVFRFIDYADQIELALRQDGQIILDTPTPGVPPEQDLSVRAARLLQQSSHCRLGATIRLHKRIPMGGGLGGGSSDAATVLIALNHLWQTQLNRDTLQDIGLQLGADVPVFIYGHNALALGVGEKLSALSLPEAWYVVLCPPVHVPTSETFKNFRSTMLTAPEGGGIMRSLETRQQRRNDLQPLVLSCYPEVKAAWDELAKYGSPLMTGSGACVFLEVDTQQEAQYIYQQLANTQRGFIAQGLNQHPLLDLA